MSPEFENQAAQDQIKQGPEVFEEAAQAPAGPSAEEEGVLLNIESLRPGDHELLAQALRNHPELHDKILERAATFCGNDTIAKALQVLAGVSEPEPVAEKAAEAPVAPAEQAAPADFDYTTSPLALFYDQEARIKDHADFVAAHPELADQVIAQAAEVDPEVALLTLTELDGRGAAPADVESQPEQTPEAVVEESAKEAVAARPEGAEQAQAPTPVTAQEVVEEPAKTEPEKESGWVVRAREFNRDHADEVAAFLAATGGACLVEGALDPNLVAQWQQDHGVAVDGRVGHETVEAASKARPETAEQAREQIATETEEEPDPTDPRMAL